MNLYKITTNIGEKFVVEKDIQSACAVYSNNTIEKIEVLADSGKLKLPTEKYDLTEVLGHIKNHCGNLPNYLYGVGTPSGNLYIPIKDVNEVIYMITGVDLNLTEKFK